MKELRSISAKKIKILKRGEEIGSSRDWLEGQSALENKIIQILSRVFKISLKELALELDMRPDSLKLALRKLTKQGLVVIEYGDGAEEKMRARNKDRGGRNTFIRFLGYEKKKSDSNTIMYR